MKQETLIQANIIAKELKGWQDIESLLAQGNYSCCIKFVAYETEFSKKYEVLIDDSVTYKAYKGFVQTKIRKSEAELEQL